MNNNNVFLALKLCRIIVRKGAVLGGATDRKAFIEDVIREAKHALRHEPQYTTADLAERFGVTVPRINALAKNRAVVGVDPTGTGGKLYSEADAEKLKPGKVGRPPKET